MAKANFDNKRRTEIGNPTIAMKELYTQKMLCDIFLNKRQIKYQGGKTCMRRKLS